MSSTFVWAQNMLDYTSYIHISLNVIFEKHFTQNPLANSVCRNIVPGIKTQSS